MIALVLAHAAAGLGILAAGRRAQRGALAIAALPAAATLVWLAAEASGVLGGDAVTQAVAWVPELDVNVDLRLDGFAALFVLLIAGIGVLIFAYSARYFPPIGDGLGRLIGLLVLFAGSMLGLVLADNLIVLFGFWELTSFTSFLLIGNDHTSGRARAAALQALLVTSTGGLAMLAGFVLIGQAAGTYRMSAVLADPPGGTAVTVGLVLVLVGAFTKSAQYPFHSWLPGAMAAPTPVSAYLHSATMVKAGVYLVGRFAPAFGGVAVWRPLVVTVGLVTMVAGGLRALRQHDLKLLLAFGTVSQLGFMVVLLGIGTAPALVAAVMHTVCHIVAKTGLFLSGGLIEHAGGSSRLSRLGGMVRSAPVLAVLFLVPALSLVGLPPLSGFIPKFALVEAAAARSSYAVMGVSLAVTLLTLYSLMKVWISVFWAPARDPVPGPGPTRPGERLGGPLLMILPTAALAALTLALGLAAGPLYDLSLRAAADLLDPQAYVTEVLG